MAKIDTTITSHPTPYPDKDTQSPSEFNSAVDNHLQWIAENLVPDINDWAIEANDVRGEVNTLRDESFNWSNANEGVLLTDSADHSGYSSWHHRVKAKDAQNAAEVAKNNANGAKEIAQAAANFKGEWGDLSGSLSVPASVYHLGEYWQLLNDLGDITTSEPGYTNSDWANIASNNAIKLNKNSVDVKFSIPTGYNACSVGPLDVNATIDVAENSVWEVI